MGGFTMASSSSPKAFEVESDGFGSAADVEDDDDGSPNDDEMST